MNEALTRVVAVRHGETAWNVQTRIQGQLDIGLNAIGRQQAERLGRALADENLDAIYASDLQRAADTARAMPRLASGSAARVSVRLVTRRTSAPASAATTWRLTSAT